jgi:hypothetical protein
MIKLINFLPNILAPLLFFTLDLTALSLAHTPTLHTLAVFTLVFFLQSSFSPLLLLCFLLLTVFSCLSTGVAFPYFGLILGILLLAKAASFYTGQRLLLCTAAVLVLTFASLKILGTPLSVSCTMFSITGNLIALYFSLKWFSAVKRGNRS